jgi:ABC-type transport system involved in multi-copper enzyme maturation permease subunit
MTGMESRNPGWLRRLTGAWLSPAENLADIVLLAGLGLIVAGGLWFLDASGSQSLTRTQEHACELLLVVLVGGWILALRLLQQRGWLKVLGPLLFYDLLRLSRRTRYFLLRGAYALLLGALLCWVYLIWRLESRAAELSTRELARFAETFFYVFLAVQAVVLFLLTPAYTAGSIAEEKDRKTLEFLLATDLRNREIVLGKFFSRLANLGLLLLTGLPILSFLQFLGGVDPNLVSAGFSATALAVASLASLSMLNSVLTRKPRDAVAVTYLAATAYLLLSGLSWLLLAPRLGIAQFPSTAYWTSPVTVEDLVYGFNAGNPIAVVFRLIAELERGGHLGTILPTALAQFAIFHGTVTVVFLFWAVSRLRAIALKQSSGESRKTARRRGRWFRLQIGAQPMIWKEIFIEPGLRLNIFMRVVLVLLILGGFAPVVGMLWDFYTSPDAYTVRPGGGPYFFSERYLLLAREMEMWVRVLGPFVACVLLLAVAARSASCVSSERDRQTMDALLTSPLESNTILFSKWLGNILSVRWGWLWLGTIYLLALLTGGLHWLAVPMLVLAWFVYAGVVSCIGLWFSVVSRTTLRATIGTLLSCLGAAVGHWSLWLCLFPIIMIARSDQPFVLWLAKFQLGFTPPIALGGSFSFTAEEVASRSHSSEFDQWEMIGFGYLGLFCWVVIGVFLWSMASQRFRSLSGRMPLERLSPLGELLERNQAEILRGEDSESGV